MEQHLELKKELTRLHLRRAPFSPRVVNAWNAVPVDVVNWYFKMGPYQRIPSLISDCVQTGCAGNVSSYACYHPSCRIYHSPSTDQQEVQRRDMFLEFNGTLLLFFLPLKDRKKTIADYNVVLSMC